MIEISIQERVDTLWTYLCDNYEKYTHLPQPSYEIDRTKITAKDARVITARMNTRYRVGQIEEPIQSTLVLYEDHFNYYINSVWGKHIDPLGVQIILDHSILHELIHYVRNLNAYLSVKKHPSDYKISSYQDYLNRMGGITDEYKTETLTMFILSKFYHVYSPLKPVYDGSFAKFKNKEDSTYMYRLSYINLYDMEKEILYSQTKETEKLGEQCGRIIGYQIQESYDNQFTTLHLV